MIPETRTHDITSTLTGEDVAMRIDQSSLVHIMKLLTDLYSDSELAVIREYATNARDAHVEAGETRPIEIELPSPLRPSFIVRDFGVGLSADDIRTIYSQYGASTKRGTNDATGMLGLGCKSALTYTDQFTLVSTKGGERVTVSVSRNVEGAGAMKLLSVEQTDAPNGTEVQVPTKRGDDFATKAADFFQYWPEGSVLVNGEAPERIGGAGVWLADDLYAEKQEYYSADDTLVMGGVPYPADFGIRNVTLTAWVPIGSVDFPPSREELMDTAKSKACQAEVAERYRSLAKAAVQAEIDAAPTKWEAMKAWDTAAFMGRFDGATYRDEDIPMEWEGRFRVLASCSRGGKSTGMSHAYDSRGPVDIIDRYWVTDFTGAQWSSPNRRKLAAYLEHHDLCDEGAGLVALNGAMVMTSGLAIPHEDWIDPAKIISWDDVRAWRMPKDSNATGVSNPTAGTYLVWDGNLAYPKEKMPAADLRPKDLYYMEGPKWSGTGYWKDYNGKNSFGQLHRAVGMDAQLAVVPANRLAKFLRDFPDATPKNEGVLAARKAWTDTLTDRQRALMQWQPSDRVRLLWQSEVGALDDDALLLLLNDYRERDRVPQSDWKRAGELGLGEPLDTPDESVLDPYPLLDTFERMEVDGPHLTLYLNAAYAANQEENH